MKSILVLLLFVSTSNNSLDVNEVAKYFRSEGVSTLSTNDFTTIFNKIEIPNNRIEKIIIKEMQWPVQGESIYVCVFYKKNIINYLFYRNSRKSKLKYDRKYKKANENEFECDGKDGYIDGVNRIDVYILPFIEGKFILDSAKHEVCQSMW